MKRIVITQTEEKEVDCLHTDYAKFFGNEYLLIPIPTGAHISNYIGFADILVLSSGYRSIKRIQFENQLISRAIKQDIPLLCMGDGMHMINKFFGGDTVSVHDRHKESMHNIMITTLFKENEGSVNSFHGRGIVSGSLASNLDFFAVCDDGVIEGIYHKKAKILGIQWQPTSDIGNPINNSIFEFLRNGGTIPK